MIAKIKAMFQEILLRTKNKNFRPYVLWVHTFEAAELPAFFRHLSRHGKDLEKLRPIDRYVYGRYFTKKGLLKAGRGFHDPLSIVTQEIIRVPHSRGFILQVIH
jgi:hypothetical protein